MHTPPSPLPPSAVYVEASLYYVQYLVELINDWNGSKIPFKVPSWDEYYMDYLQAEVDALAGGTDA